MEFRRVIFRSQAIVRKLGSRCSIVEMDGFHLANRELDRLGRHERKGAPDTFDVDGYAALLRRLRASTSTVYAPVFDREFAERSAQRRVGNECVSPCRPRGSR